MLIYIIFMAVITIFFYRESQKLLESRSDLLKELCKDPLTTKTILSLLRKVCLASAGSAICMMTCYIAYKVTGTLHRPLAAISILLYSTGFIWAMFKLKKM